MANNGSLMANNRLLMATNGLVIANNGLIVATKSLLVKLDQMVSWQNIQFIVLEGHPAVKIQTI